jgi:formyltetrahydrofolate deformylase
MILTLACPDQPGIVARVSAFLFERGCNILDAQQYDDEETGRFFMRVVFDAGETPPAELRADFEALARQLRMDWTLRDPAQRYRVMILSSKFDHCLADLLYRWRIDELPMELTAVVSNHDASSFPHANLSGIAFHHLPVTRDTKLEQEAELWRLIGETRTDIVVLARYMQVLSEQLCKTLAGRVINIHHSFLPGFKGARPYEQAHARGVKMIGATAHFATSDLDEGPIIEQALERVDHAFSPEQLLSTGRNVECLALGRALRYVLEHRVFINGLRTVVLR